MFDKVPSEKLRHLSDELARIGEEEPDKVFSTYPQFARSLSVLMRCELVERRNRGE